MIKTVMLDLGNVIVPVDFRRCHAALSAVCSIPAQEIPRRISTTGLVQRFETGRVEPQDFVREVSEILGMKVTYAEFWEIWSDIVAPEPILPESVIAALARDRRLLLLSNTNVIHFEMIEQRFPLLRHFHDYVLSYQVGAMKPDPRIYQEAIARAGCRAEECFFTDDVPAFVEGARAHGIDAVQFLSRGQLHSELAARGIIC